MRQKFKLKPKDLIIFYILTEKETAWDKRPDIFPTKKRKSRHCSTNNQKTMIPLLCIQKKKLESLADRYNYTCK